MECSVRHVFTFLFYFLFSLFTIRASLTRLNICFFITLQTHIQSPGNSSLLQNALHSTLPEITYKKP